MARSRCLDDPTRRPRPPTTHEPGWRSGVLPGRPLAAFVAERNGNQELYKIRTNGRGMVQLTNTYGIAEGAPEWQRAP